MLWSSILPGSNPPTPGFTLLVSLEIPRTCDSILQVTYTDPTYTEGHDVLLRVDVLRKEAFSAVILESSGASWYERGVERAVWVHPETQCPWPGRWLRCGKLNVAFGNEQQLCHLHTLILGSTGGIIICQTCLHNEELPREISWRSVAINVRVLPRHSYTAPNHLLPSRPTYSHSLKTWSPCKSLLQGHCRMELNVPCSPKVFRLSDTLHVQPCSLSPRGYAMLMIYCLPKQAVGQERLFPGEFIPGE